MGVRPRLRRTATAALAIACLGAPIACKKKPPPPTQQQPPRPADRLAPGELPIGNDKAFTLPLPRASKIMQRYGGTFTIVSQHTPEQIANFVRIHVKGGSVTAGTNATQFEDVVVPEEPNRHLSIEVRGGSFVGGAHTELVVRDITPAPSDPKLSNEDKWKKAGYTPDGRVLDPKHLE
jgi:hypothetical protein